MEMSEILRNIMLMGLDEDMKPNTSYEHIKTIISGFTPDSFDDVFGAYLSVPRGVYDNELALQARNYTRMVAVLNSSGYTNLLSIFNRLIHANKVMEGSVREFIDLVCSKIEQWDYIQLAADVHLTVPVDTTFNPIIKHYRPLLLVLRKSVIPAPGRSYDSLLHLVDTKILVKTIPDIQISKKLTNDIPLFLSSEASHIDDKSMNVIMEIFEYCENMNDNDTNNKFRIGNILRLY